MRIYYDPEADVLFLEFNKKVPDNSIEIQSGIYYEIDENEKLVSIEILDASKRYKDINKIEFEHIIAPKRRKRAIKKGDKAALQAAE